MTTPASEKRSRNKRATALVNEALAQYPDTPSRQLARMLMKSHPLVFNGEDHARSLIRYRRGANGGEETYETLTTITDERPMDFGAGESGEN